MFQFLQHFFITERFKEKFDGDIEPYHQKGNDEMNKIAEHKRRIRKSVVNARRTLPIMEPIFYERSNKMSDEIKKELEKEILKEIQDLSALKSGSKEMDLAIENLATLYKLNIEEVKIEHEAIEKAYDRGSADETSARDLKLKQQMLNESIKDRYFKLGLDVAGLIVPIIFYGIWMGRGLKFEETGTFTSTTFRGLFNRFKPTQK
jgi:hypothetical protein